MSKGLTLAEVAKIVNMLAPVDINGGVSSDAVKLTEAGHLTLIIQVGVNAGTSTFTITENTNASQGGATAIAFASYSEETAGGDTLGDRTATGVGGIATSTEDGIFYVVEIDASQLTDGKPWVEVIFSNPSASIIASVVGILSGLRYKQAVPPTAIE